MTKAKELIEQLDLFEKTNINELTVYSKFDPGHSIKNEKGEDIPGSMAIGTRTAAYFDKSKQTGGHYLEKHIGDGQMENFHLSHENSVHLFEHLKNHLEESKKIADEEKGNTKNGVLKRK